jgi:putative CocE/NonD family hydrolase
VTDGIRRASLRSSYDKREPLEPGKIYEVEVDLWSTSLIVNKGHRLRVAVSSSNAPRFEPNPNTGDPHPVAGKSRIATNTLDLRFDHPSHILLPIYDGAARP